MRSSGVLATVTTIMLLGGTAAAQTIGFASGPQATPTNAAAAAVAKVVNEATGLQTRAIPHTSNEVSLAPLNQG